MKIGNFNIEDEYWLDSDTFVVITDNHIDNEGISFNIEAEYHADEGNIIVLAVYDEEVIEIAESSFEDNVMSYNETDTGYLTKEDIELFNEYILNKIEN